MILPNSRLYNAFFFVICVSAFLYPSYDPDLGWHLKYGEYFLNHGQVLRHNPFSWILPDYHFYYLSLIYDIILAVIFRLFSFPGISMFAALLIGSAIFLTLKQTSTPIQHSIGLTLFNLLPLPILNVGPRSQIFSLFFFSTLWFILHHHWQKKHLWLLPLLFLVWSNTHGQFLMGLGVYGLYILAEYLNSKKIDFKQILSLGASSLITLINPFGYYLHLDIISYLNSPILRGVTEWQPWVWWTPHGLGLILYVSTVGFALYKLKPKLSTTIPIIVITIMAFRARRMVPWLLIISLPILLEWLKLKLPKKLFKPSRIYLGYGILICLLLVNFFRIVRQPIFTQTWNDYCQGEVQCSEGLIEFLETNHISGKIFNSYNLGGHLIYRYPRLPVFIDGRMILWQFPDGEYIFAQYAPMIQAHYSAQQLFTEYNFDYIIINHGYNLEPVLRDGLKWPIVYQDNTVIVFKNPNEKLSNHQ